MAVVRPNQVTLDQTPMKVNLRYRAGDSASFTVQLNDGDVPFDFTDWTLTALFSLPVDADVDMTVSGNDEGEIVTGVTHSASAALGPGRHPFEVVGNHSTLGRRTFVWGVFIADRSNNV